MIRYMRRCVRDICRIQITCMLSCTVHTHHSQTHTTHRHQRLSCRPEPSSLLTRIIRSLLYKSTILHYNICSRVDIQVWLLEVSNYSKASAKPFLMFAEASLIEHLYIHHSSYILHCNDFRLARSPWAGPTFLDHLRSSSKKHIVKLQCGPTVAGCTWFRPAWQTSEIIRFIHSFIPHRVYGACLDSIATTTANAYWISCYERKNRYNFICAHSVCDASELDWKICFQTVGSSAALDQKMCASHSVSIFPLFAWMRNWRKPFSSRCEFVFFSSSNSLIAFT